MKAQERYIELKFVLLQGDEIEKRDSQNIAALLNERSVFMMADEKIAPVARNEDTEVSQRSWLLACCS